MKPKLTELAKVIVTHNKSFKKLQTGESNIEILNKHYKQTDITYITYNDLVEIEIKKTHTNGIHQVIVWKN